YIIARENYDKNMAEHSRQMLNMQLHQQKLQNDYIEQTHHFRHDIKHHALILLSLMKQENYDEARDYLEKYTDYMDSAYTPVDVCKLPALNALINEYIKKTKELSIHFQYRVSISPYININEPELCIIVGNLLENALCACRDVPEEERYIKFFIDTEGSSQLYILIQNSFNGSLIWRNNEDIRIPEGHYGISSVRAIAKEHHGIAKFHTNSNHFFAEVMLQIEKP
ncbi:MAG: GHKL domain-containing protein, partial [Eubacteriales bacterium]|nr:GHKL domain-containing protein [Eubacteriales bacterium]